MAGLTAGDAVILRGNYETTEEGRGALAASESERVAQERVDTETHRPADAHLVRLSRAGDRAAFEEPTSAPPPRGIGEIAGCGRSSRSQDDLTGGPDRGTAVAEAA